MTGRLPAPTREQRCSSIRAFAPASTRTVTLPAGTLQADAYAGFGDLYAKRKSGPTTEAVC